MEFDTYAHRLATLTTEQLIAQTQNALNEYLDGLERLDLEQQEWERRYEDVKRKMRRISDNYTLIIMGQNDEATFRSWLIKLLTRYSDSQP